MLHLTQLEHLLLRKELLKRLPTRSFDLFHRIEVLAFVKCLLRVHPVGAVVERVLVGLKGKHVLGVTMNLQAPQPTIDLWVPERPNVRLLVQGPAHCQADKWVAYIDVSTCNWRAFFDFPRSNRTARRVTSPLSGSSHSSSGFRGSIRSWSNRSAKEIAAVCSNLDHLCKGVTGRLDPRC
jgi:hypothetical protein